MRESERERKFEQKIFAKKTHLLSFQFISQAAERKFLDHLGIELESRAIDTDADTDADADTDVGQPTEAGPTFSLLLQFRTKVCQSFILGDFATAVTGKETSTLRLMLE